MFMGYSLLQIIAHSHLSSWIWIVPTLLVVLMIAGILLRCKIARWFTLLGVYLFMLYPLISLYFLSNAVSFEPLFTVVLHLIFGSVAIYVLSNEKAMDVFFIHSNPKEHLLFLGLSCIVLGVYFSV